MIELDQGKLNTRIHSIDPPFTVRRGIIEDNNEISISYKGKDERETFVGHHLKGTRYFTMKFPQRVVFTKILEWDKAGKPTYGIYATPTRLYVTHRFKILTQLEAQVISHLKL